MVEVRSIMKDTVFADGIPRIRPLLIFHGKGLRIKTAKRSNEIEKMTVQFQKLRFFGYRKTGAAISAIHQRQVPMANYLLQIFIEANRHLR